MGLHFFLQGNNETLREWAKGSTRRRHHQENVRDPCILPLWRVVARPRGQVQRKGKKWHTLKMTRFSEIISNPSPTLCVVPKQWPPFVETPFSYGLPCNSLVSDPWKAFWADTAPIKGPQLWRVLKGRRSLATSKNSWRKLCVKNAVIFVVSKKGVCGHPSVQPTFPTPLLAWMIH